MTAGWKLRRAFLPALALAALGLVVAPAAGAAPITLGSPLTAPFEFAGQCNFLEGCEATALSLSEPGAVTASPVDGTVIRWRAEGTTSGVGYGLSVLRRNSDGTYTPTAVSPVLTSAGLPTETFAADLPIQVGEYVAISLPVGAGLDLLASPGLTTEVGFEPPPALGVPAKPGYEQSLGAESAFNAEVEPVLSTQAPSGSSGGSSTAAPPPAAAPKCLVPRLGAKKLTAAKKALKKADCKLGRVTRLKGATAKSGVVVSQSPQSGKKLAAGAKVAVKLAPPKGGAA